MNLVQIPVQIPFSEITRVIVPLIDSLEEVNNLMARYRL